MAEGRPHRVIHIHAGLPKTGTTALQAFLMRNRALLQERALVMPETGLEAARGNHHALAQGLGSYNPLARANMARTLSAEIENRTEGDILVSSEFIYLMCRYASGITGLKALARRGITLKFYLFVRPQPDLAISSHPEFLRNMLLPQGFDAYLSRNFPKLGGDFTKAAGLLESVSPGNVYVLPYNRANRRVGVWWTLLEAMGHGVAQQNRAAFEGPGTVNLSLDAVGVAALEGALQQIEQARSIRRWSRRRRLREVLLKATEEIKGGGLGYNPMSPTDRARLWQASQPQNDALAKAYWTEGWNDVFADERATKPESCVFTREAGTPEDRGRYDAHRAILMDALLTKIARMKARARPLPFGIFTYPVDYAGDRILRAITLGR